VKEERTKLPEHGSSSSPFFSFHLIQTSFGLLLSISYERNMGELEILRSYDILCKQRCDQIIYIRVDHEKCGNEVKSGERGKD
jgi:hypothetical protein